MQQQSFLLIFTQLTTMNLSLFGNNKGNLESWASWLTQLHTFASGSSMKYLGEKTNPRYELILENCTQASIDWMLANFNPKSRAPYTTLNEWHRGYKAPPRQPTWRVHCNLELRDRYSGLEENAKAVFEEATKDLKVTKAKLYCEDKLIEEIWR